MSIGAMETRTRQVEHMTIKMRPGLFGSPCNGPLDSRYGDGCLILNFWHGFEIGVFLLCYGGEMVSGGQMPCNLGPDPLPDYRARDQYGPLKKNICKISEKKTTTPFIMQHCSS